MKLHALVFAPLMLWAPSHSAINRADLPSPPTITVVSQSSAQQDQSGDGGITLWPTIGAGLLALVFVAARRRPQ